MDEHVKAFLADLEDDLSAPPNDSLVPPGERACPICNQKMLVEAEQGINIDVCPAHGVWLDRNELAAIISNLLHGERFDRQRALRQAQKDGKIKGAFFGVWALLFD